MPASLAHGVDQKFFAKAEVTFDTNLAFAGTDALGLESLKIEPSMPWQPTNERVGTASAQAFVKGMRGGKWTAVSYVKPNGAGVAPDIGELIRAAMGTETVNGGVSVVYSLADAAPVSLQLARRVGDGLYEVINGAVVEQMDLELQGNSPPKITFSGSFATYGHLFGCTVAANALAAATTVQYTTTMKGSVSKNARVAFGSEDNAGAGYLVTAVDNTVSPPTMTISPGLANGITLGDAIKPLTPTPSISGTILAGVGSGLTIDATAFGAISSKWSLKTGFHLLDKEATADRPTYAARGKRELAIEHQIYFLDQTNGTLIGRGPDGVAHSISTRFGENTAAKRMIAAAPSAWLMDMVPIEVPEADEALATIKHMAKQSAAAADEFTLSFT
jgi:hypothetical protein